MPYKQERLKENDNLWSRFKEGDDLAFYRLYDLYADSLFKYGSHFSKDIDFLGDCIHDLFLNLYKYRKKLSETDNIQFYLFRSLRRIIHKELVKAIPLVYDEMIGSTDESLTFSHEDYLIAEETEAEVHGILNAAMKTLSNRQREGLLLKFEYNRSYPEISEIMGISVESARTIIYRALKELRTSINGNGHSFHLFFLSHYLSQR
jgi:RNA polymerase sigma factor (sigma-70 family)